MNRLESTEQAESDFFKKSEINNEPVINNLFRDNRICILAIGSPGCIRILFFRALAKISNDRLKLLILGKSDIITGTHITMLKEALVQIIKEKIHPYRALILYISCVDIMIGTDFEKILNEFEKSCGIPVKLYKRGPLSKRRISAKERIKKILFEIENFKFNRKITVSPKLLQSDNFNVKNLLSYLPPFASDYSGVSSVLFELNSLNILFSPGGCFNPVFEIDEIRNVEKKTFYGSHFNDLDTVFGSDEKLCSEIISLSMKNKDTDFISVIGTPVSYITGFNFERLSTKVEKETGKTLIFFNTNGFANYSIGISQALLKMAKTFTKDSKIDKKRINILGYTPLSFGYKHHLDELIECLKKANFIPVIFGESFASVESAGDAFLNIVISNEALLLAEYLKEKFNTPYFFEIPIGYSGIRNLLDGIGKYFALNENNISSKYNFSFNKKYSELDVVVIGEFSFSFSVASCFKNDFGINNVSVLLPSNLHVNQTQLNNNKKDIEVYFFDSEKFLKEYNFKNRIVVGDPIYKNLIKKEDLKYFIPLPFPALSGKLYAKYQYEYIGKGGFNYFRENLKKIKL